MALDDRELQILRDSCVILSTERMRINQAMIESSNVSVRLSESKRELDRVYTALCLVIEKTIESKNGRD